MVLQGIDEEIENDLFNFLNANSSIFIDKKGENSSLFKNLMGVIDITRDSLQQKRLCLLGCKMKIYQERMRQIQFLEILTRYKQINNIDKIYNIDKRELLEKLDFCEQISKKIQHSLKVNQDDYQQLHVDATLPCSITMSCLTNAIYGSCDLWTAFNK